MRKCGIRDRPPQARFLSYQVFFFTLYSLGLRLGEALCLQLGDIDAAHACKPNQVTPRRACAMSSLHGRLIYGSMLRATCH